MESHNDDPSGCQEDEIFPKRAAAQTGRRAWSALTDDVTAAAFASCCTSPSPWYDVSPAGLAQKKTWQQNENIIPSSLLSETEG